MELLRRISWRCPAEESPSLFLCAARSRLRHAPSAAHPIPQRRASSGRRHASRFTSVIAVISRSITLSPFEDGGRNGVTAGLRNYTTAMGEEWEKRRGMGDIVPASGFSFFVLRRHSAVRASTRHPPTSLGRPLVFPPFNPKKSSRDYARVLRRCLPNSLLSPSSPIAVPWFRGSVVPRFRSSAVLVSRRARPCRQRSLEARHRRPAV